MIRLGERATASETPRAVDNCLVCAVVDDSEVAALVQAAAPEVRVCSATRLDSLLPQQDEGGDFVWLVIDSKSVRSPVQAVHFARSAHYLGPVLVILRSELNISDSGRLFQLDARMVGGDVSSSDIALFLHRSEMMGRRMAWLSRAVRDWRLSPREIELLVLCGQGVARADLAEALRVSENTVKSQVRSLLRKSRANNLFELVSRMHGEPRQLDPLLVAHLKALASAQRPIDMLGQTPGDRAVPVAHRVDTRRRRR